MAKKRKKKGKKRKIIIISVIVLVIIVVVAVTVRKSQAQPIAVQTEKVQRRKIVHKVTASGTIQPEKEVQISANNSALIMEITVEEGDDVMVGQLLISLDRTQFEAAVEQAHSRLKSAEATLVEATRLKERAEKLYDQGLISSEELESVTAKFEQAESSVELSKAALKSALDDLSKTNLLAPTSGTVTQILKEEGDMALGSMFQADVLMTIADLSHMMVVVEVNENDVVDVAVGDTAEIEIDAFSKGSSGQDTMFYGVVKDIAQVAKTTAVGTQEQVTNYHVEVQILEVPKGIRQGMSATANIITDVKEDVLAIPIQSLTVRSENPPSVPEKSKRRRGRRGADSDRASPNEGGWKKEKMEEVVFVVSDTAVGLTSSSSKVRKKKGARYVEQRPVKVGLSSETYYEVVSGLNEGEEIVTGSYKAISRELQHNSLITREGRGKKEKRAGRQ